MSGQPGHNIYAYQTGRGKQSPTAEMEPSFCGFRLCCPRRGDVGLPARLRTPSTPSSSACVCHRTPRLPHSKSFLFDVASFNLTNPKHELLLQQAPRPISIKHFAQSLLYRGTSNTQIKPLVPRSWAGCGGLPAASGSPITPISPSPSSPAAEGHGAASMLPHRTSRTCKEAEEGGRRKGTEAQPRESALP